MIAIPQRKVIVSKWKAAPGQKAERVPQYEGLCHGFGDYRQGDDAGTHAIVEKADGTIDTPDVSCVQFVVPEPI